MLSALSFVLIQEKKQGKRYKTQSKEFLTRM